jgi:hypothetical protein
MATLYQHLSATPRRMLLAIARARDIRFPWEAPRSALVELLAAALADAGALDRVLQALPAAERSVLEDLLAAGGRMPRRHLAGRYGEVRPYRPWQPGAPRRPWEAPISPLERLCFLGVIFLDGSSDDLAVPDDMIPHLPALELAPPEPAPARGDAEPALLAAHDLACLLGLLQRDDLRPRHGRWLPPRPLRAWGERCARPPARPAAAGELQTGRRRFLHYLAEAAGLLGLAGPYLKPTPAAWLWLADSPAGRLDRLWQALAAPDGELWLAYRLPGHALLPAPALARLAAAVAEALRELDPADPLVFADGLLRRRPALRDLLPANLLEPETALLETIHDLLAGPYVWLGVGRLEDWKNGEDPPAFQPSRPVLRLTAWGAAWLGLAPPPETPSPPRFAVAAEAAADPEAGAPAGALVFSQAGGLPDPADLVVLMDVAAGSREFELGVGGLSFEFETGVLTPNSNSNSLLKLPTQTPSSYRLTPASFARALGRGWSAPALLDALDRLAERPLTGQERAMLRAWAEAAGRTAIRRLTVLETTDPGVIARLAATRRGRALIVRTLSPRAVVVDPARLDQLVRRLEQQEGVPPAVGSGESGVESLSREFELGVRTPGSNSQLPTQTPYSSGAAHLWLALHVLQGLGEFIRLPARTPQALWEGLAALAGPDALGAAETAAEAALEALREALVGRVPFPPWPEDGLPVEESRAVIQAALAGGQALDMDYYTAGRDALTRRVVEPWRLEGRGGVIYLVGFCRRAQAERVFRLDRIRRVVLVEPGEAEKGFEV